MKKILMSLIWGALLTACASLAAAQVPGCAAGTHCALLTWTDTLNPTGTTYNVYRATGLCSGTPTFAKIATAVAALTYTDKTVTTGNYCFGVTATLNGIESAMSPTVLAPVPAFVPGQVQLGGVQ